MKGDQKFEVEIVKNKISCLSTISSSSSRILINVVVVYFKEIFGFNQAFSEMHTLKASSYKNYKIGLHHEAE